VVALRRGILDLTVRHQAWARVDTQVYDVNWNLVSQCTSYNYGDISSSAGGAGFGAGIYVGRGQAPGFFPPLTGGTGYVGGTVLNDSVYGSLN
jgi:hypothetical protein